jgi:gliding motility-associated-like protein
LDEANSQTTVIFDSVGIFTLNNFSLNNCGGDSGVSAPIRVFTPFDVNVGPDKQGCIGDSVTLHATSGDQDKVLTTSDTAHAQYGRPGGMFNIIAHGDVIIDSFAVKYSTAVPLSVNAEIWSRHGSYKSYEQQGFMWNNAGGYNGISPSPLGQFTVIPYFINQPIATNDTFGFYLTTSNQAPVINEAFRPSSGPTGTVFMSDGIIDFVQGTANNYSFGAFSARVLEVRIYYSTKAGLHYLWNTGDTSATVTFPATTNGQYSIQVYDTSGCQNRDTLFVTVHPKPTVEAGADTLICGPNGTYTLNGSASVPDIVWSPSNGLSSTTILNPQWNNTQPQRYYLTATDPLGCANVNSVFINTVTVTADAGTAVTICNGDSLSLAATSSVPGIEWQPATGLSDVHSLTPAFSHNESITYTLIATDTSGCAASDTVSITVNPCNDSYLKVPSAFAPNGNGQNDYFTVFGKNIATYEIRIYNRWGQVVYNSNDPSELNDLSRGWDGKYKGALQELGTFVYYITAHDIAGRELTKKGNLTLIR